MGCVGKEQMERGKILSPICLLSHVLLRSQLSVTATFLSPFNQNTVRINQSKKSQVLLSPQVIPLGRFDSLADICDNVIGPLRTAVLLQCRH